MINYITIDIEELIEQNAYDETQLRKEIDWLKSLKNRVLPQPKQEWKQENTSDLTDFENAMMHIGNSFFGDNAGLNPNDTNAIKEQANLLLGIVPSKEWSEEDESWFKELELMALSFSNDDSYRKRFFDWLKSIKGKIQPKQEWGEEDEEELKIALDTLEKAGQHSSATWLKNVCLVPQSHWKPSDEQMNTLEYYMHTLVCNEHKEILFGLYADLKKLKG